MRKSFQFTVTGPEQTGVVYVTMNFADEAAAIVKATKLAAKRSGDPAPKFIRSVPPMR